VQRIAAAGEGAARNVCSGLFSSTIVQWFCRYLVDEVIRRPFTFIEIDLIHMGVARGRPEGEPDLAIKLINIGFGNIVSANRIISIVSPESAPIKRIIQEARDRHMLIDATYGRRTRAVIITDSDHVILSAVQPETVAHRLSTKDDDNDE
jgi:regulator of extracellular matrix RemA (YlzA/DUF370 family)